MKCPKCKEDIKISDLPLPPIRVPAGFSLTANKLYEITKRNARAYHKVVATELNGKIRYLDKSKL